ncbi:Protein N-acetyltransferase, RimJ/RimL family [Actinokineospora iranica]|uniref:Protein N-acetyltransferase, RimJ/RimL family n=2 Tax=Actinokineospora iranica TaxID=1271860 RepID=A0A1G6XUJ2_9PSEU|nr:Protein N-acetyltransferase, RimJ/RimL family [Actinokineospora iranica]
MAGRFVRLEPLTEAHVAGLYEAGKDPDVWTWLSAGRPRALGDMRAQVADAIADPVRFPFVQFDANGEIAGTTSYYEVDQRHRAVWIGHTWIGARWQRTALNTESKLLLMSRAFDEFGALRVGWHTDVRNERSRRAIERLGARQEGVLRAHRIRPDGTLRDTVCYSVIAPEWPAVRDRLLLKLHA